MKCRVVFPYQVLYDRAIPSLREVVDILKKVGRQEDAGLVEVMTALEVEFDSEFGTLASFVLDGICFATRQTP